MISETHSLVKKRANCIAAPMEFYLCRESNAMCLEKNVEIKLKEYTPNLIMIISGKGMGLGRVG